MLGGSDGSVATVAAAGGGATRGAAIAFAAGGTALVEFDTARLGARLTLVGADATVLHDGALPLAVDTLPVLAP